MMLAGRETRYADPLASRPGCPLRVLPLVLAGLVAAGPAAAQADRDAPLRERCATHARAVLAGGDDAVAEIVLDAEDQAVARFAVRRTGAQPASAVASGSGGLRRRTGERVALRWVCVLDDRGRAVFFHAGPEPAPRSLAECWRWSPSRAELDECLASELLEAERALEAAERGAHEAVRRLTIATGRQSAMAAQAASDQAWRAYRDAECDRIAELAAGGSGAGDFYRACLIDRARARIRELGE